MAAEAQPLAPGWKEANTYTVSPVSVLAYDLDGASGRAEPESAADSFSSSFAANSRPPSGSDIDQLLAELRLATPGDASPPLPANGVNGPPHVLVHQDSFQSVGQPPLSPSPATPLRRGAESGSQRNLRSCKSMPASPYIPEASASAPGTPHRPQTPLTPQRSQYSFSGVSSAGGSMRGGFARGSYDGSQGPFSPPPSPSASGTPRSRGGRGGAGGAFNKARAGGDSPRHRNYRKLWNSVVQVKRGGRLGDNEVCACAAATGRGIHAHSQMIPLHCWTVLMFSRAGSWSHLASLVQYLCTALVRLPNMVKSSPQSDPSTFSRVCTSPWIYSGLESVALQHGDLKWLQSFPWVKCARRWMSLTAFPGHCREATAEMSCPSRTCCAWCARCLWTPQPSQPSAKGKACDPAQTVTALAVPAQLLGGILKACNTKRAMSTQYLPSRV